ncbi:hypothetical protein SALBM311S_05738 [Streptomyces alboniger]
MGEQYPHGDAVFGGGTEVRQERPTRASMPSVPRSICWTAATAVNSLVREARSKGVSTVIGTRAAGGSSTPASVSGS